MPEFLTLLPPREALSIWLSAFGSARLDHETIAVTNSSGRVTVKATIATDPLPQFPRSSVDGYAVRAVDTHGASDGLPAYFSLVGEVPMGGKPVFALSPGKSAMIHTGGMLPENADAVVMLEFSHMISAEEIEVYRAVAIGENCIQTGEDVKVGQEVIPANVKLRAPEIGGLAAIGITSIAVKKPPRIGLISTGDEVVPVESEPLPGQVRDINMYSLGAFISAQDAEPVSYGIIRDNADDLSIALEKALRECDAAIITAGSSASTRDLTAGVIQKAGQPGVLVHGINVRPGKPTILAVCDGKPVVGLPGNPVSALVIGWLFLLPMIEKLYDLIVNDFRPRVTARLRNNLASQAGREDWIPVKLFIERDELQAEPVFFKSNLIFNMVKADGLLHIPADASGIMAGEVVQVFLIK